ncbi:MAG: SDR family NAD(P)-dependent oxidoreductase [Burkholderiales bacterium]
MKASQLFDISGHVALVTGAASGLGLAYAEVLAHNGAHVAMLDLDPATLKAAAQRLLDTGCKVTPMTIDVGDTQALRAVIDSIAAQHGRLDIAFANAGISSGPSFNNPVGEMENLPTELWERVLKINLTSVFETIRISAHHMKKKKSGRIVVTASIAGLKGDRMVGYGYAATKAAVINLVRQAALELAPHNIMVNAIAPGPFLTNIAGGRLHREPEVVKQFAASVPLGRIANTDEIKGLALYLASPASSFHTGTVIPIDGGSTAG